MDSDSALYPQNSPNTVTLFSTYLWLTVLWLGAEEVTMAHLALDALDGVDDDGHSTLVQRLEALLRVYVHARQPAPEARVTVIPAHHHLRPAR